MSGSVAIGVYRCCYCTKTTSDPSNELNLAAIQDASMLRVRPLGGQGEGLANPVLQNYCREVSYSASSYSRTKIDYEASHLRVYQASTDLPALHEWLNRLTLEHQDEIFEALNGAGYTVALLVTFTDEQLEEIKALTFNKESFGKDWKKFCDGLRLLRQK